MGTTGIILAGDFNEDPRDDELNGINKLMNACELSNIFETMYGTLPSTRNNNRSIDHILISTNLIPKVTKAGLVPKDIGFCTSDHQALFVDFNPGILETRNVPLQPANMRKLRFNNAPKVEWYAVKALERAHSQNIQDRLNKLFDTTREEGFTDQVKNKLEKIDHTMCDIMLLTESELCPDTCPFPFSEDLLLQAQSIRVIKQMRQLKRQHLDIEIDKLVAQNPGAEELKRQSIPQLNKLLQTQRRDLRAMQDDAGEYRTKNMETLYEKAKELFDKDKMQVAKEMQEREKQSRLYNKLAFVLTNERFQAITRLGIPKGMMGSPIKDIWDFLQAKEKTKEYIDGEYTEDESEIKLRLREWNILHFAQASETPLATE